MRPVPNNPKLYEYGIIDEASKINLNTVDAAEFAKMPGVTQEFSFALMDWRDGDSDPGRFHQAQRRANRHRKAVPMRLGGRRAGKLYLPSVARYFGCRRCYDLTYRSCQESHKFDTMWAELGRHLRLPPNIVRLIWTDT